MLTSATQQDLENQKLGVLEYANHKSFAPLKIVTDDISSRVGWRDRNISEILDSAKADDALIVSEISRLARSTLQVLEILDLAEKKKLSVNVVKNSLVMDGSIQATITATVLGLAAQIEKEFISLRTNEALTRRKESGRPKGRAKWV